MSQKNTSAKKKGRPYVWCSSVRFCSAHKLIRLNLPLVVKRHSHSDSHVLSPTTRQSCSWIKCPISFAASQCSCEFAQLIPRNQYPGFPSLYHVCFLAERRRRVGCEWGSEQGVLRRLASISCVSPRQSDKGISTMPYGARYRKRWSTTLYLSGRAGHPSSDSQQGCLACISKH